MPELPSSVNVDWSRLSRLSVPAAGEQIKVIELVQGQVMNRLRVERAKVKDGLVISDLDRDLLKLAVIERHRASGNMGVGLVKGFGLKRGALGSSVAHDSHNVVVLGTTDEQMKVAAGTMRIKSLSL